MTLLPDPKSYPATRLFALDAMRGLDMCFLVIVGPLVRAANQVWHFSDSFMHQFTHPWTGFTAWDIIMAMFIFMCGAAVPFGLRRRLNPDGKAGWPYWRHVVGRAAMLWILGMLCQGRLATLDPLRISVYSNTLQTIAVGYVCAAGALLIPRRWIRVAIAIGLFSAYGLLMHFCGAGGIGDYSKDGNFAQVCENVILNAIMPAGTEVLSPSYHGYYTWWLTSLIFAAIGICGCESTETLRSKLPPWRKVGVLFASAAALVVTGLVLEIWVPCNKHLFSVSYTAQAMGWCVGIYALLYVVTDIWQLRRGWGFVLLFGQFALTAYLMRNFFGGVPGGFANPLTQGFPRVIGATAPFWQAVAVCVALAFILVCRRKMGERK